ncbi:MAG: hypothetical protein M1819_005122 [Sarea resinae]|nr:MAG: hypothetical protein M1819_005122 [Sarea resinae]
MSFNAKNLSYEKKEPSFLQKLKRDYAGSDSHRHQIPIARPRRQRDDDIDDEPVYVEEESNDTISKAEYDALLRQSAQKVSTERDHEPGEEQETTSHSEVAGAMLEAEEAPQIRQKITEVGAGSRKRKAPKVITEDDREPSISNTSKPGKKKKSQKKSVKLSFGDDAEEG